MSDETIARHEEFSRLPGGESAIVAIEKLTEYCLSPDHPLGKHKARVFRSVLAMTDANAEELRGWILSAATTGAAKLGLKDEFGTRYIVDFKVVRQHRRATIRTAWILSDKNGAPRFLTCFIL